MDLSQTNLLILSLGAIGFGIILLIKGGDWTIDAAVTIAQKFNIPKMIIGFTIVAFGTSLPELIVAINANLKDAPGIALGNVIGSNIANILLVLATTAIIAPLVTQRSLILRDTLFLFIATAILAFILIIVGGVSQIIGGAMVAVLFAYMIWQFTGNTALGEEDDTSQDTTKTPLFKSALILLMGLICVALGAEVLVRGAEIAASIAGVPSALIGLTIIAIGTSLPELSTCLAAIKKGESDIILGNIIGSNVFNILMIIGITSLIKAIPAELVTPQLINFDIIIMTTISILFGLWMLWRCKLSKISGIIMLSAYVAYMGLLYFNYMV